MSLFPQGTGTFPSYGRNTVLNTYPGMSINIPPVLQQPQLNTNPKPVLVGVHGFDSIKKFPTEPNQTLAFHDMDADFEYVVDTDVNNQPSYKILEYRTISEEEYREKYKAAVNKDIGLPTAEEWKKTLERLEKLEKEVNDNNAKQSVQSKNSTTGYTAYTSGSKNLADVSGFED